MSPLKRSSLIGLVAAVIVLVALAAGVWVASQQVSLAKKAKCGDNKCQKTESFQTCPDDCPNPCGNGKCEKAKGETTATCPQDCPNPCGNGKCEKKKGENKQTCPQDCGGGGNPGGNQGGQTGGNTGGGTPSCVAEGRYTVLNGTSYGSCCEGTSAVSYYTISCVSQFGEWKKACATTGSICMNPATVGRPPSFSCTENNHEGQASGPFLSCP